MKIAMSLINRLIKPLGFVCYSIVSTLILLELAFRILPTSDFFDLKPALSREDPLRFFPDQELTYSLGWNFYQVSKKKTNNYGFVSPFDYEKLSQPDLVVVGDSYVEAMQVDDRSTVTAKIASADTNLSVYSLGISGVPLSQYIEYIKFAEREFQPKAYVIVVVGNDFDESLCAFRRKDGIHCYDENFKKQFIPSEGRSLAFRILRHSALVRYIRLNLRLSKSHLLQVLNAEKSSARDQYAGNTKRNKSSDITLASKRAIDLFLEELKFVTNTKPVTLVIDGDRQDIYAGTSRDSYFNAMRDYLIEQSRKHLFEIVDMDVVFREHFQKYRQVFEFQTDGHWNGLAHGLAAEAVLNGAMEFKN